MESEGILSEILSRVGRKAQARFKCVSKLWCYVISKTHLRLPQDRGLYILPPAPFGWHKTRTVRFKRLIDCDGRLSDDQLSFDLHNSNIIDSSNGLLLIITFTPIGIALSVRNPVTDQQANLPPSIKKHGDGVNIYGLTYDPSTAHYQVIHVFGNLAKRDASCDTRLKFFPFECNSKPNSCCRLMFEVFSSETNSWTLIKQATTLTVRAFEPTTRRLLSLHTVFFDGAVHWIWDEESMLVYHLADRRAELIKLPKVNAERTFYSRLLFESQGRICCCCIDQSLQIYELFKGKNYIGGFKWRLKYSTPIWDLCLQLQGGRFKWPEIKYSTHIQWEDQPQIFEWFYCIYIRPVGFIDDLRIVYLQLSRLVFAFNLDTKTIEEVCTDSDLVYPFVYQHTRLPLPCKKRKSM